MRSSTWREVESANVSRVGSDDTESAGGPMRTIGRGFKGWFICSVL